MPHQSKKKKEVHRTKSQEETKNLASKIRQETKKGGIICLYGTLGAGKTTFVKGLASDLGIPEISIKSPTYTYLREYETKIGTVHHFDLYRLEDKPEIARMLVAESLDRSPSLILIEWAEYLGKFLPEERTDIRIKTIEDDKREIEITHYKK